MLRTYFQIGKSVSFLALLSVLPSCATRVAGLQHDPSFTYQRLRSSTLTVAGVVPSANALNLPRESRRAALLVKELVSKRPDITLQPTSQLLNAAGMASYKEMLEEYRQLGFLSEARLLPARSGDTKLRYLLFARIEKNDEERELDHPATEGGSSQRKMIIARTTRGLDVSFRIYDLQTLKSVWSGAIKKYDYNRKEYPQTLTPDGKSVDESTLAYPPAPSVETVLRFVFKGFVENLPAKKN